MSKIEQNPRNCSTCFFNDGMQCGAPVPNWVSKLSGEIDASIIDEQAWTKMPCGSFKPKKGEFVRICLNCGKPIRTHHKYAVVGEKKWVHKYCDHPESPSKWHYERYGKKR